MNKISSSAILQINTTFMIGMLLFFTIDDFTFSGVTDLILLSGDDVYLKQIEHALLNSTIFKLKSDLQNLSDIEIDKSKHIKSQITDLELQYYTSTEELKYFEKRKADWLDFSTYDDRLEKPIFAKSFLSVGFAMFGISSIIQLAHNKKESSSISRGISGGGIMFCIFVIFYFILIL